MSAAREDIRRLRTVGKTLAADALDVNVGSPPEFSDDALALEFAEQYADLFRWSPGLGWMVDDGTVWRRDQKLQRYDAARLVCRAAAKKSDRDDGRRLASARTVSATLSLAQADQRLVVADDVWDRNPMLLNVPGGIVDLRTGKMRSRGVEYVTQVARVAPADVSCPVWKRFIADICQGDRDLIEFMRRSLGYALTGDRTEQVLFFWYGLGANGKSVLAELVQWIAGNYSIKLPSSVLMQTRGERHPTELAMLRGKRLAVSSELDEGGLFNESLLKELTGDATLTARFMRADFFEFQMAQKHVIVGNFKPRLRGGDPAMARRMLLVPFLASFKGAARDPHMLDRLKAEAPAILHWIVSGAVAWAAEGLAVPVTVRASSADYMAEHDDVARWFEESCEPEGESKSSTLYANFVQWKKARGETASSMTAWGTRLTSVPGIAKRSSNGVRYSGVRPKAVEAEAPSASRVPRA